MIEKILSVAASLTCLLATIAPWFIGEILAWRYTIQLRARAKVEERLDRRDG